MSQVSSPTRFSPDDALSCIFVDTADVVIVGLCLLWFQCDSSLLDWLTCIVQAHTCMHERSHICAHMHIHFYREINKDNRKERFLLEYFFPCYKIHALHAAGHICDLKGKLKKLTLKHACAKLQDYTKTLVMIVKVVICTHNVLCVLRLKFYLH